MIKLLGLFLLAACSSTPTQGPNPTLSGEDPLKELFDNRWILQQDSFSQKYEKGNVQLKVDYEYYMTFEKAKVKKDVVCHFIAPIHKTIIATTEAPAMISYGHIKVLRRAFEKQEYKETLAPVSGKGPNKYRSVFCNVEIEAHDYNYQIISDELILKPIAESIKLKKYIQK